MSTDLDLNKLDQQELERLRADVDQALKTLHARRLKEARDAATALAKEHGFKLEELVGAPPRAAKAKAKLPAKYANPDDPDQTWSGKGRKPKWFNEAIASGKTESDLAI